MYVLGEGPHKFVKNGIAINVYSSHKLMILLLKLKFSINV